MAGLLQQGMGQQAQSAPQQGAPPRQATPGSSPQPPPPGGQPQAGGVDMDPNQGPQQRERLVGAMLEALYGNMLDQVITILRQNGDEPQKAIGRILAQLMTGIWKRLAEQGKSVPPGVMVQSGMVVAQAVGEMAVRLRLLPEQGNADPIEAGFMLALGEFGKATREQMPAPQRQRYAELIRAINEGRNMSVGQEAAAQPEQGEQRPAAPQQPPAAAAGGA
ncbi:MAG: hypothetical protein CME72_12315 [Halomonadaceae bacterium]|nr:hypothetical protein [Halomonadaceae bacterium]